jgi:small subunit ribosomal protein S11
MAEETKPSSLKPEKAETAPAAAKITEPDIPAPSLSDALEPIINQGSGLNLPEELPDEIKKKLEKNKADRKVIKKKGRKKKVAKKIPVGIAHVKATYNNTIVALTDLTGNVISWASAGMAGFKGPKKSTPYAAQIITRIAVEKAKESGLQEVSVFVKGVGTGRESAIRALNANGLIVSSIKDVTPIPHNGCRPKKPRRV